MRKKILILIIAFVVGFAVVLSLFAVFRDELWNMITQSARENEDSSGY